MSGFLWLVVITAVLAVVLFHVDKWLRRAQESNSG